MNACPPAAAVRLGALATLPFLAGAALVWLAGTDTRPFVAQALCGYAAVVASFIGAIHWGLALPREGPRTSWFAWGVVPSIVAWIALLLPARVGLAVDAALLVLCYLVDRARYPTAGVAGWLPLRLRLTIVAVLCCIVGAAGT